MARPVTRRLHDNKGDSKRPCLRGFRSRVCRETRLFRAVLLLLFFISFNVFGVYVLLRGLFKLYRFYLTSSEWVIFIGFISFDLVSTEGLFATYLMRI